MINHTASKEIALIADLKAGIPEAVEVWYRSYMPVIQRFVSHKVDNKKDVEEIARETFLNCLRQLPLFQQRSTLKTWMLKIASHEVADYYRKRYAKKFIHAIPLSGLLFVESPKDMHDTSGAVVKTLSQMKTEYKQLLLLKYVDQISVREIAQQFDRSVKSIESDLFRARKEFRALYLNLEKIG